MDDKNLMFIFGVVAVVGIISLSMVFITQQGTSGQITYQGEPTVIGETLEGNLAGQAYYGNSSGNYTGPDVYQSCHRYGRYYYCR